MTNKLTRRHFLATLASAAAGALVAGVVKVEPEPAEWDDIGIKPLGPQYLIKDDFGDMSWTEPATDWYLTPEAGEDVRGPAMGMKDWAWGEGTELTVYAYDCIWRYGLTSGGEWVLLWSDSPTYESGNVQVTFTFDA